ncbi:chaperone protein DnaK [Gloeobacter kilaueensis JS1]|uniref:Chaperone protein DnaK n=1 Tax=Gloeobacter kilaueensis (strain ATCC BAA-2537 / CCAP 1431/1 / ULC 316 / JS1) TaxID=1183438 RepID=U5QIK8_GLOK1|nr:chaperone protein DnaK [Gloeobacter kilaueensis JS1]
MYSFDFGTSNTVVARWNRALGEAETLAVRALSQLEAPYLIPSLLYVEDAARGQVLVGQEVLARGLDNPADPRFFSNFKRGIGSTVQGFMPEIDGVALGFEKVGLWFLQRVIKALSEQDAPVEDVVFTVPVNSFEVYRQWLLESSSDLAAARIQLIDESTAAALGYGLEQGETVLVIDFGGGTLDLSLVQPAAIEEAADGFLIKWGRKIFSGKEKARTPTARVLAKVGRNLGGMDIDTWLADSLARQQKLPSGALLQRVAERLKIRLSSAETATEVYFDEDSLRTARITLDREQLEALLTARGFFGQLDESLDQLLQQARRRDLDIANIDAAILVGGSCRIPAVQQWAIRQLGAERVRSERVFEAVAHGALRVGRGLQVEDFLYHGYGVRYWDHRRSRHGWHPLFKAGQAYPTGNPLELVLGASVSNQPNIELVIGELGDGSDSAEVFFENGRLTLRASTAEQAVRPLNDSDEGRVIAQLEPPGFPGRDRVKVQLRIDAQRQLRITVEDLETRRTLMSDQPVIELR